MVRESLELKNAVVVVLLDIAMELVETLKKEANEDVTVLWKRSMTSQVEKCLDRVFSRFETSEMVDDYLGFRQDLYDQLLFIIDELCEE